LDDLEAEAVIELEKGCAVRSRALWQTVLPCILFASVLCHVAGAGAAGGGEPESDHLDAYRMQARALSIAEADLAMLKSYKKQMQDGTYVAIERQGTDDVVFMRRDTLRGSLQRYVIQSLVVAVADAGEMTVLRQLADPRFVNSMVADLERDVLEQSNAYLPRLQRRIDVLEQSAARLRDYMRTEDARLRASPGGQEILDLSERKKHLGVELERIRRAGDWIADHHFQVGTLIAGARTSVILDAAERLMRDYASCYFKRNADRQRIADAARAGRYPTPGDRIGELSKSTNAFNGCIGRAAAKFGEARRR
jgi:hypothetical protein